MGKLKQRKGLSYLFKVTQLESLVLEVESMKLVPKSFWRGGVAASEFCYIVKMASNSQSI